MIQVNYIISNHHVIFFSQDQRSMTTFHIKIAIKTHPRIITSYHRHHAPKNQEPWVARRLQVVSTFSTAPGDLFLQIPNFFSGTILKMWWKKGWQLKVWQLPQPKELDPPRWLDDRLPSCSIHPSNTPTFAFSSAASSSYSRHMNWGDNHPGNSTNITNVLLNEN